MTNDSQHPLTSFAAAPLTRDRLVDLAAQWRDLIAARGRRPDYVTERYKEVCWVLAQAGYELTDAAVTIALGRLRDGGMGLRSCNKYLGSIKSFCAWLARPSARLIPFNPLAEIPAFQQKRDRRYLRTSFLPVLAKLLATTAASRRLYRGVPGRDRAELYHAAACTGLRLGTLKAIDVGQFHLDAQPVAFVTVRADQLKDAEDLILPIQPDSAARLRKYLAGRPRHGRAFRTPPHDYDFTRMLRKDLAEAGIQPYRRVTLADGRTRLEDMLDFHALRHTFGSWCASSGVPLTTTQKWMGHSEPSLTANVYTHVVAPDQAATVLRMPPLPGVRRVAAGDTGTAETATAGGAGTAT
jgi:integrase